MVCMLFFLHVYKCWEIHCYKLCVIYKALVMLRENLDHLARRQSDNYIVCHRLKKLCQLQVRPELFWEKNVMNI